MKTTRQPWSTCLLREAVKIRKDFCVVHGDGTGIRLLAFVTPGDFMANTPVDFLLNGSNAVLWFHYVDETTSEIDNLPDYDVAFFAIGEANHHGPVLARMKLLLSDLERPVMNNDPPLIAGLTRDGVSAMFADEPSILAPQTWRIDRGALQAVAAGGQHLRDHGPELDFPVIVRPIGTHAGGGMACARDRDELARYLLTESSLGFYVAPFIDYSRADGLFSKQRIVFIDGKPFASHLALSEHWMVHYLSAGMTESASKRAVEADWMECFDTDFAVRHADAFEAGSTAPNSLTGACSCSNSTLRWWYTTWMIRRSFRTRRLQCRSCSTRSSEPPRKGAYRNWQMRHDAGRRPSGFCAVPVSDDV